MERKYVMPDFLTGGYSPGVKSSGYDAEGIARFTGCSLRTVENWRAKTEKITGPIVTLLNVPPPCAGGKLTVPPLR